MPARKPETYTFGGVDGRSNPANFPPERSIRCINWVPQEAGQLRLRSGYTVPMQVSVDTVVAPIHSALYYEQFSAQAIGPQYILYGKGTNIYSWPEGTGSSAVAGTMPSANRWGHFRNNNYIHLAEGSLITEFGFSYGIQMWDGTTMRPSGIPTPSTACSVGVTSNTAGSFAPTTFSGYQLWIAWYDPITQHMGNGISVGTPFTIGATTSEVVLTNVSQPPNLEWVTAIGMTNDGGQIPYWLWDANFNHIVIGNANTQGTVTIGNVDVLSEFPARNIVGGAFDKFARVGTRFFAHLSGSPFIYYSNDVSDVQNSNYVGDPAQSWPLDQAETLPTGELPRALHGRGLEGWFFSLYNLSIWSTTLQQQGANPWRGPWQGGAAGQRACVLTPYGMYWVTGDKEIATFMDDGVISVSQEYESALLSKIADKNLANVEISYLRDADNRIDQLVVLGQDVNGDPVVVVHDFMLRDARSPFGQAYQFEYQGMTPQTFVGSAYTPRQPARDVNGKNRLWVGTQEGFIAQVEDNSTSDNGAEYSADFIGLIGMGAQLPTVAEFQFQGDSDLVFSYSTNIAGDLSQFEECDNEPLETDETRWVASMGGEEARWLYIRLQLTSHGEDGNFTQTDPPFVPMPTYGCINMALLKEGTERPEARG